MNKIPYKYKTEKICTRCIMDDSVTGITFDKKGVCTFCHIQDELEQTFPLNNETNKVLQTIVDKIKKEGKRKEYDCIVGVSGGKDSSFTLVKVVELGLRPLVVHFDNGWNSDLAVQNIKNLCVKLDLVLHTHIADWEEFRDLQKSFLFASVPDGEVPTDWAITSVLHKIAAKEGIRYIIGGNTFRTEGTTPLTWTYQDPKYIKSIQKQFGHKKIKSFPIMNTLQFFNYSFIKKIRWVRILYYLPYNEDEAVKYLTENFNWQNYGGKHFESTYTKFFQSYILTRKFNIDKRKLHFSALIRSNQIDRDSALKKIIEDPYEGGFESISYTLKKLGITEKEFDELMNESPKNFLNYPSLYKMIILFKKPLIIATKLGIVPNVILKKYFRFDLKPNE
ncbi:MAG TPA: N-acetyl sugar amidotransferase [Bacteroidales bacterium]|nr:N-acetyl sugar amidotransferase [Bacteroidales bacterium]